MIALDSIRVAIWRDAMRQDLDASGPLDTSWLPAYPMPMSKRFTERAQRVILIAQEETRRLHHGHVEPEHLLLGILALGEGVASQIISEMKLDSRSLRPTMEQLLGIGNETVSGEVSFTAEAKKVLELSVDEAEQMGHSYVGTEHLLLGALRVGFRISPALEQAGLHYAATRTAILNLLGEVPSHHAPLGRKTHGPFNTNDYYPNMETFLTFQGEHILARPNVSGILLTNVVSPTRHGWRVLLILIREGTDLDYIYELYTSGIPGFDALPIRFKLPGRKPVWKKGGQWIEDDSFTESLNY
jgi:hypothetical protein